MHDHPDLYPSLREYEKTQMEHCQSTPTSSFSPLHLDSHSRSNDKTHKNRFGALHVSGNYRLSDKFCGNKAVSDQSGTLITDNPHSGSPDPLDGSPARRPQIFKLIAIKIPRALAVTDFNSNSVGWANVRRCTCMLISKYSQPTSHRPSTAWPQGGA